MFVVVLLALHTSALCQLVNTGGGPGTIESQVASLDFAQIVLQQQANASKLSDAERERRKKMVDSGMVSALDLAASSRALHQFNDGVALLRTQHSEGAAELLQKAIVTYPKFVSAHNALGLAYVDLDRSSEAKSEFETAAQLDGKYSGSFLNLGRLALSQTDFEAAQSHLQRAASIRPTDPVILTALAYAQNGTHHYREALETVTRVHATQHPGMGNAHYIGAAAALALNDRDRVERELTFFLNEDPANTLAPVAKRNLDLLAHSKLPTEVKTDATAHPARLVTSKSQTSADSERLKAQLKAVENEPGGASCEGCEPSAQAESSSAGDDALTAANIPMGPMRPANEAWTIRKVVDEVAIFFSVSNHGHIVTDLELAELQIRDDGKAPAKTLQFAPQSKLPLRVALLIDTSGSVQPRFSFEKYAATKFLQQLLTNPSDKAFVAGFANTPVVMQDFTAAHEELAAGVSKLTNEGGTALFDAVSFACGKLAAYPERERVAKVLVVVSDGEDNSSHTTLRQAIRDAEATGVTVYAISTKEGGGRKTDADQVLETLADRSGGEALFPGDSITLRRSFDKLRDIIRSRYLIAYKPADFEANGKYRAITIVAEKNGKRLQVHARKGYRAPYSPSPAN